LGDDRILGHRHGAARVRLGPSAECAVPGVPHARRLRDDRGADAAAVDRALRDDWPCRTRDRSALCDERRSHGHPTGATPRDRPRAWHGRRRMTPDPGSVRFERRGTTGTITFDRPNARNALTWTMYKQLDQALDRAAAERGLRVLVLRGASGNFVAGTDIAQF